MASKYGGIPVESKYGGVPVDPGAISGAAGIARPEPAEIGPGIRAEIAETGPVEATFIGMGKGLFDIGRGLGIIDPATPFEREAFAGLEQERPYTTGAGEIVGQAMPFVGGELLLPELAAGAAVTPGLRAIGEAAKRLPRWLGTGAVGAAEAGTLVSAEGGRLEEIGAATGLGGAVATGAELLLPVLGRLVGKVFRNVTGTVPKGSLMRPDGLPTDEMMAALDKAGLTWEDLKVEAQDLIAKQEPGAVAEDVARMAGFEQMGAPALRGEVTKDFGERKLEQQLLESASEKAAEPIRQVKKIQSEAMRGELDTLVDNLGITGETGDAMKGALNQRKAHLKGERSRLYGELGEAATEAGNTPIISEPILSALPDKGTIRDIAAIAPNQYKALNDLLVEFGIEQGEEAVASAAQRGIDIDPLGLHNFESFRKRLNGIASSDQTGAINVLTGPLKTSLDAEIDLATAAMEGVGGNIGEMAKAARQSNIALKTEFDEKSITAKLIDPVKRGSTIPKVEVSKAYNAVMAPNTPIENLERLMGSLAKAGGPGQKAVAEMQGRAVLDLVDSAFSAQSRQIDGQRVFGAGMFSKQYEKLLPKLELLFAGDPKTLAKLNNVYERAQDIIPPAGAVPKGSAGFFVDALNKIGVYSVASKIPFAREVFEIAQQAGGSATARSNAKKALNARPKVLETANMIQREFPQIAAALGIAALIEMEAPQKAMEAME